MELSDARALWARIARLQDGAPVRVDGQDMTRQTFAESSGGRFGHPDSATVKVGYGIGRYNRDISADQIRHGFVVVEIPQSED